jgi:hypothetical protein
VVQQPVATAVQLLLVVLEVLLRLAAAQPKLQQQVLLPSWILRHGDSVLSLVRWLLLFFNLTESVLLEVIVTGAVFLFIDELPSTVKPANICGELKQLHIRQWKLLAPKILKLRTFLSLLPICEVILCSTAVIDSEPFSNANIVSNDLKSLGKSAT